MLRRCMLALSIFSALAWVGCSGPKYATEEEGKMEDMSKYDMPADPAAAAPASGGTGGTGTDGASATPAGSNP